jgi:hypothetical protein
MVNFTYVTSFKILENDDAYIELIENYPCECKDELCKREGEVIRKTEKCVIQYVAGRTDKEYYQDNKEQLNEYSRQYREDNKEQIKQYYQENKAKLKEYKKQHYQDNIEKIKERKNQRLSCECGCIIRRDNKARHERTMKHKECIANLTTST